MNEADFFIVASRCFAPVDRASWEEATDPAVWREFVSAIDSACDFQSEALLSVLSAPPSFEEKERFASHCFTGGLPTSAMPVESLYFYPEGSPRGSEYLRDSAAYMYDLTAALGLTLPDAFASYPDHVALELEVAALLWESDREKGRDFAAQRFTWLRRYREKLASKGTSASFYAAVAEGVACVVDAWCKED